MEWDDVARIYKLCWINVYLMHVSHIGKIKQNGVACWLLAIAVTTRLHFCRHKIQSACVISIELFLQVGIRELGYTWCYLQRWLIDWLSDWLIFSTLHLASNIIETKESLTAMNWRRGESGSHDGQQPRWRTKSLDTQRRFFSGRDCPSQMTHYCYYYCISHFSPLAGKYSPILGCGNQQD